MAAYLPSSNDALQSARLLHCKVARRFAAGHNFIPGAIGISGHDLQERQSSMSGPGPALAKTPWAWSLLMTVKMILKEKGRSVVTVLGGHTMEEATRVLQEKRIGAAIVVDAAGRVVGVLSERDIVRAIATDGVASLSRPLREFMTREVHTCTPEDTLDSVMGKMTGRRIRHLPVMEAERLAGIISIGDVVKMKIAASEHEAEALKQYIVAG